MKQTERQKKEGGEGRKRGSDRNKERFYERESWEKERYIWDGYGISI